MYARAWVATLVGLGVIAVATMSASPTQADGAAREMAGELCQHVASGGSSLALTGPRLRWSAPVSDLDARAAMQALLGRTAKADGFLISSNDTWIVVHDRDARMTAALDCGGTEAFTSKHEMPAAEIAVSHEGDLALRTESGDILIAETSKGRRSWSTRVNDSPESGPLLWLDRRLIVLGRTRTYAIDLAGPVYRINELSVVNLPDAIVSAWAYRGLTFVLGKDGCIDMLADMTLMPHLRRVACVPAAAAATAYIGFDADTTRVFTPQAQLTFEGRRLLALSARLTGTVREMTTNLRNIAAAPWAPAVPVVLDPSASAAPLAERPAAPEWSTIVQPDLWPSQRDFQIGLASIARKGWSDVRDEGQWFTANGIALRWQTGPEFVTPAGRSLTAIAGELYYKKTYSDEQLENVLAANGALGRSLEGRLFELGWIPLGAAFGPTDRPPLLMAGAASVSSLLSAPKRTLAPAARKALAPLQSLKATALCGFDVAAVNEAVTRLVDNGISALGRSGISDEISKSTNLQVKAASAHVVRCTNASGVPVRLLILRNAVLNTDEGRARARAGEAISGSANGLTFAATRDASWPVGVQADAVIAVAPEGSLDRGVRAAFIRQWLDDVFVHGRIERVLIRVSLLDLVIAADVSWYPRTEALAKVRLVPAERVFATARSLPAADPSCDSDAALLEQQQLFDQLLQLNAMPPALRAVDVPIIGVVETAVMRSDPMFRRADGRSVWEVLNEQLRFTPMQDDSVVLPDKHSLHGTRVAGLLFSVMPPNGVLSDARLTWVDESSPDTVLLNKLAGTFDIVNVSARLHDGWRSHLQDARTEWKSALFVAAAHNKDEAAKLTPEDEAKENDDGMPLVWRLPNIIGVGAADALGNTSKKALTSYDGEQVDLLAPGYLVPAVGPVPDKPLCLDGTSFAAAYVSAVAALLQQKGQGAFSPSQLRARLLATATWKDEYWGHVKGGLINAGRALDGLFDNVLTFPDAQDPRKSGLQVTVKLLEEQFRAIGTPFSSAGTTAAAETLPVFWSDVLRLTKTGETVDAAGRRHGVFYMAFVDGSRYRVWKNVRINPETSAMPITQCLRRKDGASITCTATDVNGIFDYVGQRYRSPNKIEMF